MKNKMIIVLLIVVASANMAFAVKPPAKVSRKISIGHFERLVVKPGMNVILVQSTDAGSITVAGDEKCLDNIKVTTRGGEMILYGTNAQAREKVMVYIPVSILSSLEVGAGAKVSSQGMLSCGSLSVVINDESVIAIQNTGDVSIKTNDCDFVYVMKN